MTMTVGTNFSSTNLIKNYASGVKQPAPEPNPNPIKAPTFGDGDSFQPSVEAEKPVCPKISKIRAAFSRLTDEQIRIINQTRELPVGTKFVQNVGGNGFNIQHNYFGLTAGTRILPAGYELKKGLFGFTVVLPEGAEGLFIKDVK